LPCAVSLKEDSKDTDATGIYLNFLKFENSIIMPSFAQFPEYNKKAQIKLEELYDCKVFSIEASLLAEYGGIINCVTWAY
jgi:agmatine/peptidylarginine deiminase